MCAFSSLLTTGCQHFLFYLTRLNLDADLLDFKCLFFKYQAMNTGEFITNVYRLCCYTVISQHIHLAFTTSGLK